MHLPKIHEFSGAEKDNLTAFIFQTTDIFNARKMPLEERLVAVTGYLSGNALQWYLQIRKDIKAGERANFPSWEGFTASLKDAFEPACTPMALRIRLRQLRQVGSLSSYISLFRNISGQLDDISKFDLIVYFMEGLRPDIRSEIVYRSPS